MESPWEKHSLKVGALAVMLAVAFRLAGTVLPLGNDILPRALLFWETGRLVKAPIATEPTQSIPETQPQATAPQVDFSQVQPEVVAIRNAGDYGVDVQALLETPLSWDLTQDGPAVLIVHSHASESYQKTEDYRESSPYRTLDTGYNVVSVGRCLAEYLRSAGVEVLHDETIHDSPSYNNAYQSSRASVEQYLEDYPSIRLVLDLHRDSATDAAGNPYAPRVQLGEQTAAQLMLVMGTNSGGNHPRWQENLALAVKLQAVLETQTPGLCRDMVLRSSAFNQDLSSGALLIEMGATGNTRQEVLYTARLLGEGILTLAYGSAV